MAPRTMTSPPSNRLSAVYIGPAHIPDLPDPPSPGRSSSSDSGLPSPPATNSTGSGGDSDRKEKEGLDRRGHKLSSSITSVASLSISSVVVPKGASILEETLPLAEMDDEEDTARVSTLQRVKSLKDRNRLVLDRLVTHSPAPSASSRRSHPQLSPHNDPRSGSETERESTYSRASSTHHRAFSLATSTPQHEQLRPQTHRSSVPSTPSSRHDSRGRGSAASGSGSSSRRRARLDDGTARLRERAEEILDRTKRDSPGAGVRRRGALPAEFRNTPTDASTPARAPRLAQTTSHSSASSRSSRHSLDLASHSSRSSYAHSHSHSYSSSPQPQPDTDTPDHSRAYSRTHTPSPATPALPAPTPRAQPAATVSTATATGTASRRAAGTPILGMTAYRERRQTLRGGSAESALSNRGPGPGPGAGAGRRTLIGEELRAAGLSPSKSRVGRGRLSLGWDAEEEAGGRALTALSLYVEGGARERERRREEREMRARERSLSRVRDDLVTPERERERERETTYTPSSASALARLRTTTGSSASASTSTSTSTTTAATPSPFGSRRHAPGHTEHTRLLGESLGMFEAQLARCGACGDTLKSAQGVVGAAARLNEMLRAGTARALGERVRAEVEGAGVGGTGAGAEEEVWGRVGAEYREGLRVSDELVRGLTGLFIGFGRVVREFSGGGAEGAQHARSASLDAEALGMGIGAARGRGSMSPDVGGSVGRGSSGAGSVSGSGRRSVESRQSWDASAALALREEVSKRLVARAESALGGASRPGTAFGALRERALDTPPQQAPLSAPRRLFTPREQREMQLGAGGGTPGSAGGGMPTIHSQETLYGAYEPSPTPASRVTTGAGAAADRSRALPPLGVPKPLPSLPSETASRRTGTSSIAGATQETGASAGPSRARDRETRKVSSASTSTVRGSGSGSTSTPGSAFPVTAPAGATTAVTPHTVSTQAAGRTAFPALPRTDSDRSVRASVAFSRASTVSSVSALVDVRRQDARRRTESSGGGGGELSASASEGEGGSGSPVSAAPVAVPAAAAAFAARQREWEREREAQSGSETERPGPPRRTQVGKMTLDAKGKGTGTGNAQDRSAVVAANAIVAAKMGISGGRGPQSSASGVGVVKRERRRTVTDIWPQD